jgi:uncharacterized membrane protein (DUF373 family)
MPTEKEDRALRRYTEKIFGQVEDVLYVLIALCLAIAGFVYFGYSVYEFASHLGEGDMTTLVLDLLDGLLLVFIITEIIHTIRAVIDEKVLVSEPFLVVGVVAGIRRLVVVSAQAKDLVGTPEFGDAILEIGVLTGTIVLLGATIFMLRHTDHSEPRPEHEPGD